MLGAIGVGVWAMIFMTALTRGMVDQMIIDSIGVMPGHVQMHDPKFADDPSVSNRIVYSNAELTNKFQDADFEAWASRVKVPAIITSERDSRGITLLGVDPSAERNISFLITTALRAVSCRMLMTKALSSARGWPKNSRPI